MFWSSSLSRTVLLCVVVVVLCCKSFFLPPGTQPLLIDSGLEQTVGLGRFGQTKLRDSQIHMRATKLQGEFKKQRPLSEI